MNTLFSRFGVALCAVLAASADARPGVVVLELFTSQGCSSCPPADRLLSRLAPVDATKPAVEMPAGAEIIALSFHVDYWNNLGWKDPFSSAAASQRQREYARRAGSSRVYTPQLIVNGAAEFVGSDESAARREIAKAAAMTPEVELSVASKRNGETVDVEVTTKSLVAKPDSSTWNLTIAIVEDGLVSRVTSGENSGEKLRHDHVVRGFVTMPVGIGTAKASIVVPGDVEWSRARVVAYVQESSGRVVGAGVEKK